MNHDLYMEDKEIMEKKWNERRTVISITSNHI